MTDELFLITGGGTGAKVAEAFVHLCAAGLGPKKAHLLLIDSDTANGNLARASATARVYQQMQAWPWNVRADVRQGPMGLRRSEVWLKLFGTEVHVHALTEQIQTVSEGGLGTAAETDPMRLLLDLLYDASEQQTDCSDGFRARPNLGCLLLADHLDARLPQTARPFLEAMRAAAQNAQARVPVVVCASVFGGTGASLLPIARRAVEQALVQAGLERDHLRRFEWGSVKLLPHYQPAERRDSVDPDRFLLDTASALQFYSTAYATTAERSRYDAIYVVGSNNPGRNRVRVVLGEGRQSNAAYFEEFLSALAVLRFAAEGGGGGGPMRVLTSDVAPWKDLPHGDWHTLRENLAFLLHLAAFYLRRGSPAGDEQRTLGVGRLLRNLGETHLMMFPWYSEILEHWAEFHDAFKTADRAHRVAVLRNDATLHQHSFARMLVPAAEYFGRLLLWSESALQSPELMLVDYAPDADYAGLYDAMAKVKAVEIDSRAGGGSIEPASDNGVVRVLRTAATAMVREHRQSGKSRSNPRFVLVDDDDVVRLRATAQQIDTTLREFDLGSMIDTYSKTTLR